MLELKQPLLFLGAVEATKRKNYRCLPLTHFRRLQTPGLSLAFQARARPLPGLSTLLRRCGSRRSRLHSSI